MQFLLLRSVTTQLRALAALQLLFGLSLLGANGNRGALNFLGGETVSSTSKNLFLSRFLARARSVCRLLLSERVALLALLLPALEWIWLLFWLSFLVRILASNRKLHLFRLWLSFLVCLSVLLAVLVAITLLVLVALAISIALLVLVTEPVTRIVIRTWPTYCSNFRIRSWSGTVRSWSGTGGL